jgi:hypothetical protein
LNNSRQEKQETGVTARRGGGEHYIEKREWSINHQTAKSPDAGSYFEFQ